MKNKLLFSLFVSVMALAAFAQVPDKAKLDSYFDALEANNKFMGNVTLSQNGKTVYTRSLGFADVEKNKKNNEGTKFRIGSISKMFTTVLIFKAVEDKKLKLTDNIGGYFPTIPNASKITIGHMLSHRSGIHNFTNDDDYTTYMTFPKTEAEMVAIIAKSPSEFEPGTKADYSNSNFVLLSYILEKVNKKPYKEQLEEKITKPLGLKNTFYGTKINSNNNEAYPYGYMGKWEKDTETDMSIPMGAGAVVSNTADLSRFIEALFAGKVVSAQSLEQMKTIKDGFGMGLFPIPFEEKKGYGHGGAIDSFTSGLYYFPEDKLTYAMTSNGKTMNNNDISVAVLSWFYNKPFDIPNLKAYKYIPQELDAFAGTYTSKDFPVGIVVSKRGDVLVAQATGQGSFPLESVKKNIFTFDAAGIVIEFTPLENKMVLKQEGTSYTFIKSK